MLWLDILKWNTTPSNWIRLETFHNCTISNHKFCAFEYDRVYTFNQIVTPAQSMNLPPTTLHLPQFSNHTFFLLFDISSNNYSRFKLTFYIIPSFFYIIPSPHQPTENNLNSTPCLKHVFPKAPF